MKQIHTIIGLCLAVWCTTWVGCSQEDTDAVQSVEEGTPVTVKLNLSTSPLAGEVTTRATASYTADVENLIHDVRVLQYNSMGILIANDLCFDTSDGGGVTQVNNVTADLIAAKNCTLVALVNMEGREFSYPELLSTLRKTKYDISFDADTDRLPMKGAYTGDVTSGQSLNFTLGRLAVRVNLVLTNSYNTLSNATIQLTHIPLRTYLYTDTEEAEDLSSEDYGDGNESLYKTTLSSLKKSSTSTYYYFYLLPNYCSSRENASVLTFQGTYSKKVKTFTYHLGEDAAGYTLYPNSIYNVTLTLSN
jgi:hypothetical protein